MRRMVVTIPILILGFLLGAGASAWWHYQPDPPGPARPAIVLPDEISGDPARLIEIQADSRGPVRWHLCNAAGLDFREQGATLWLVASKPGQYRVLAWTTVDGNLPPPAMCTVKVGDQPPEPDPHPDPFVKELAKALAADLASGAGTKAHKNALAVVYRQAADVLVKQTELQTIGDLYQAMRKIAVTFLPESALPNLRKVIAEELRQTLPTDAAALLTETIRAECAKAFQKIADALERLP